MRNIRFSIFFAHNFPHTYFSPLALSLVDLRYCYISTLVLRSLLLSSTKSMITLQFIIANKIQALVPNTSLFAMLCARRFFCTQSHYAAKFHGTNIQCTMEHWTANEYKRGKLALKHLMLLLWGIIWLEMKYKKKLLALNITLIASIQKHCQTYSLALLLSPFSDLRHFRCFGLHLPLGHFLMWCLIQRENDFIFVKDDSYYSRLAWTENFKWKFTVSLRSVALEGCYMTTIFGFSIKSYRNNISCCECSSNMP